MNRDHGLTSYIKSCLDSGMTYTQVVFRLAVESGYALPVAHRMVDDVTNEICGANENPPSAEPEQACPDIRTAENAIDLGDRTAEIAFEQHLPRVVLLDNFLSHDECDRMCAAATEFTPSHVMEKGGNERSQAIRNSDSAGISTTADIVSIVEHRINRLTGWPITHGETMQIQRYGTDQRYVPHYDFYLPDSVQYEQLMNDGGQRIATLILYLQTPEKGGATQLVNLGLKIAPRKGSALFFSYPDPTPRSGTLHSGEPVISGEKWIATKWFRQKKTSAAYCAVPATPA